MRGVKKQYCCKRCNKPFLARIADRLRGWAQYCSKSCKQVHQEEAKKIVRILSQKVL